MSFSVKWTDVAVRDLGKLDVFLQKRIIKKVDEFAVDGSFHGIKRVIGESGVYRLRVGDFRILFEIVDNVVYVAKVGHRKNIY